MTDIQLLIKQYWSGDLNQAEKQLLIEMLEEKITDYSDNEYSAFLQMVNKKEAIQNMQDPELRRIFHKIENRLNIEKVPAPVYSINSRSKLAWIAAAVLFATIIGWWLFNKPVQKEKIASNTSLVWVTCKNGESSIRDTMLSEGSIIKMYPNTEISFVDGFIEKKREIKMSGKALFKVAKDTSRPFIVYAGGFSTNALGTEFEVNTLTTGIFLVKLLKGKVVVKTTENKNKPMIDVFLSPGENLKYDMVNKKAIVSNIKDEEDIVTKNKNKVKAKDVEANAAELVFTRLPLTVIFQQLESEYSIMIVYDLNTINGKEYSGSFKKTDNPGKILNTIANKFGWKVHIENAAYKIE